MEFVRMTISEIKNYMKRNKITYEQLALLCNGEVAISTIKDIMRGKTDDPRIKTIQAIERALGLDERPAVCDIPNIEICNIKKVLKERKITYLQLSELSGIPLQTISKIFAGITISPRLDTIQAIERALGINKKTCVTHEELELYNLIVSLSPIQKGKVISFIQGLLSQ